MHTTITHRGVSSLEVVIGVSIAALILVYASQAIGLFLTTGRDIGEKTQALYLAEDGLELLRYVRDDSWGTISGLPLSTTRYLTVTAGAVAITTTPETVGQFTRSFTVSNVYRDATQDIVDSSAPGSSADTDTKYVTVTVSWGTPAKTVSLTSILANLDP